MVAFPESDFSYAYVKDPKGKYMTMTGKRVSKTRRFKRGDPNFFESDLPIETRVLTDIYLQDDSPSQGNVVLFFDIEVSTTTGFPNVNEADNEITSIALYDPLIKKYQVFVLDTSNIYNNKQLAEADITFCDNEINLLHSFINAYEEISPTIISGWNSNGFDVPYLYNRMRKVCGPSLANRLSPIGKVTYSDRLEKYKIAGVSSLDYLELYKKFTYSEQPNYRLDTIGRIEVDMGKVEYDGSLNKLFETDLEKFIEYNLQDVRIIVALDEKLNLIELVRGICHIGHVPYEDFGMSSRFLEGTIITYLHRKGIVVTNKPVNAQGDMDGPRDKFTGAFVKEPIPGVYDWVYSLDLQSLYPSIIMSLNISPETKVGKVLNWDIELHMKKQIVAYVVEEIGNTTTVELEYDSFMELLNDNNLSIASNGVLYTNDKRGIIPEILEEWFSKRKEYKDTMKRYVDEGNTELAAYYDRRQHIQKIFLNSLYGVLGLPVFRFYDVDNAVAVTLTGQDVIKTSAAYVNKFYNRSMETTDKDYCIYIDTDSLYFSAEPMFDQWMSSQLAINPLKLTIQTAEGMEFKLNEMYNVMAKKLFNCNNHKFHIKGESVASTGFWVTKKRYVLDKVYDLETHQEVSKIVVKGLDVVRSSFPKAFREFVSGLLVDILRKVPKSEVDRKILDFRKSMETMHYLDIARNISANNISKFVSAATDDALNSFAKGTPVHIKAAMVYNRLLHYYGVTNTHEPLADGEKIKYVYLKNNPLRIKTLAIRGYHDPKQIESLLSMYIDTDALFENELKTKLQDFYDALGWGLISTDINQNASKFFVYN